MATENMDMDYSKYDFKDSTELYVHLSKKGLSKDVVRSISKLKDEPQWMLDFRLRAYDIFMKKPMPTWGADLSTIDFQNIFYYAKATEKTEKSWDDVPEDVKNTFDKLGIPEAEKKFLAGSYLMHRAPRMLAPLAFSSQYIHMHVAFRNHLACTTPWLIF